MSCRETRMCSWAMGENESQSEPHQALHLGDCLDSKASMRGGDSESSRDRKAQGAGV